MSGPAADPVAPVAVRAARNAVMVSFVLPGFAFATWVSRIPDVRSRLDLTNSALGLLLLVISIGSVVTLPTTGVMINRLGAPVVLRIGVVANTVGLVTATLAISVWESVPAAVAGLFAFGLGIGIWDVAMNVEGAAVEKRLGHTIMPRFHAAWSLGTVMGALVGAAAHFLGTPMVAHLLAVAAISGVGAWLSAAWYLPRSDEDVATHDEDRRSALAAWVEPRTLLIGLMMLGLALTEGTANDWLAVALIDGYGVTRAVGVIGFAIFVTAMTGGRLYGPVLLDRYGRVPVLWSTMALAGIGVLLIVFGVHPVVVVLGIVAWGLGASLGFPVGMSAAADDPAHAASRVSVVSTIAYTAFLAGPPLLGLLADRVGTLEALLAVGVVLIPCALAVPAAREPR